MTGTFKITTSGGPTNSVLRAIFLIAASIGGLFVLAASAMFAFFIAAGVLLLGGLTFGFFWVRAKVLGKPFGPQAHFEKARAEMEAQFGRRDPAGDGPIIDAHRTPEGWSVDD